MVIVHAEHDPIIMQCYQLGKCDGPLQKFEGILQNKF